MPGVQQGSATVVCGASRTRGVRNEFATDECLDGVEAKITEAVVVTQP